MNVPVQVIKYDISSMNPAYVDYIQSEKDNDTRKFRVKFYSHDTLITLSNSCTATATITIDNVMIEQELVCTITDNSVEVTANATRDGVMAIQITLTDGDDKLTMQRPIFVRVTNDIAETAQIDDDSHGSFAEVVQEIADARGDYISLSEALNHKLSSAEGAVKTANIDTGAVTEAKLAAAFKDTLYKVNTTDWEPNYETCEAKTIYVGAKLGNERGIIIPFYWKEKQIFIGFNGTICVRHYTGGNDYQNWEPNLSELTANKKASITSSNQASTDFFPSIKAVVDYIAALFATVINNDNKNSNALLPTIKAVVDYLTANYTDTTAMNTRLNSKADTTYVDNRLNSKADSSALTAKENLSNKISTGENLHIYKNSTDKYPAAKAIVDYLMQYYANKKDQGYLQNSLSKVEAYIGYTENDILGLQVDFVNNRFTRLAGAEELDAGSDFDDFPMFGGRRRCCVANDGTVNAYYGEQGYAEDGTNGQVMVYQPKFYYRMVPLKLEKQASGIGYHIRKANYYVTANPHPGFKLHPLFYDANGNEIDYVLLSAYEGSMYDVSASAYVNDSVDSITYASGDLLCSVGKGANDSGKKPISGKLTGIGTKANFETMANNRGTGWHLDTIQSVAANQLLMLIELGRPELQSVIGNGCVSGTGTGTGNASSLTGSTSALGNETGMATKTIAESAGETTECTENGKLSVSYRGLENPWGNIWKHINGINLWGDGTMNGGQAYVCHDFSFNEQKKSENYEPVGFTVSNASGYISAFGYGAESYDWLFLPSETSGSSAVPVGDRFDGVALNGYKELRLGGKWNDGAYCGAFCLAGNTNANLRHDVIGCRMLYVPTATV